MYYHQLLRRRQEYLAQICGLLKENLSILSQVEEYLGIFFDALFSFSEEAKAVLISPENREALQTILNVLEGFSEMEGDSGSPLLVRFEGRTGRKGKSLYALLRAGITGKMKGPELVKILPLLGKDRMINRLKMALELS